MGNRRSDGWSDGGGWFEDPFFGGLPSWKPPVYPGGFVGPPQPPGPFALPPEYIDPMSPGDFVGPPTVEQWKEWVRRMINQWWAMYWEWHQRYKQFVDDAGEYEWTGPLGEKIPTERFRRMAKELLDVFKQMIIDVEAEMLDSL